MHNPELANYVSGIAVHWYMDFLIPIEQLDMTHDQFPNLFLFGTEACEGFIPIMPHVIMGSFDRAESYANSIIEVILFYNLI